MIQAGVSGSLLQAQLIYQAWSIDICSKHLQLSSCQICLTKILISESAETNLHRNRTVWSEKEQDL